jgi:hypothetical protein
MQLLAFRAWKTSLKMMFSGWGQGVEMAQALYAHMNNKRKKTKLNNKKKR